MVKSLLFVALLLLPLVTSAPTKAPVSDAFCKVCKTIINMFITGDEETVFKNDMELTDAICGKFLTGPMVQVCAAGIVGEMDFIRDKYNDDPNAICVSLGCPSKSH